jgi:hypothetical protein
MSRGTYQGHQDLKAALAPDRRWRRRRINRCGGGGIGIASRAWPGGATDHLATAVDQVVAMVALSRAGEHPSKWIKQVNERSARKLRPAGLAVSPLGAPGDPRRILLKRRSV